MISEIEKDKIDLNDENVPKKLIKEFNELEKLSKEKPANLKEI